MAGTRWVRLDVDYFGNPKTLAAGPAGRALHLASICWTAAQLTDGHIPEHIAPFLCREAGVSRAAIGRLLEAGLWARNGQGYTIHDYVEMNPTRAEVEKDRQAWRDRQRRFRQRRDTGEQGEPPEVTP